MPWLPPWVLEEVAAPDWRLSDLSVHGREYLGVVAARLNARPCKSLGWLTPAERLWQLTAEHPAGSVLSGPPKQQATGRLPHRPPLGGTAGV